MPKDFARRPQEPLTFKSTLRFSLGVEVSVMEMNIGKLAALAGVGTATVRYYERRGLLGPAARTHSGYRRYDQQAAAATMSPLR
jgi:hypothetical protein